MQLLDFMLTKDKEFKLIAILEEIHQELEKMDQSADLHELLGDLYKKQVIPNKLDLLMQSG